MTAFLSRPDLRESAKQMHVFVCTSYFPGYPESSGNSSPARQAPCTSQRRTYGTPLEFFVGGETQTMRITKLFLAICLVFAGRMAPADAAVRYFDVNDTGAESGVVTDQIYTWDTAALNWNPVADGSGTAVAWVNGDDAVFSAGSDAVGSLYGLNVTAGTTATSALLEDGALTVLSGAIDTGTGTFTVGTGVGSTAVFQVDASPTLRTNAAGKLQLHGGTYRMVTNQTVAHSFLSASKSLEINVEGTIDHQELA